MLVIAGIGQFKFIVMRNRRLRKTQNECAQMACESASAIRTVAALTLEDVSLAFNLACCADRERVGAVRNICQAPPGAVSPRRAFYVWSQHMLCLQFVLAMLHYG